MKAKALKITRRNFVLGSGAGLLGSFLFQGCSAFHEELSKEAGSHHGPGMVYRPKIWAAFVRRKEPYGILWPGAVYDGEKAKKIYTKKVFQAEDELGFDLVLRKDPIHTLAEADAWIGKARKDRADGLLVLMLDRQRHSWPTAGKAASSGIPTVVFSPLGTSFTFNTAPLFRRKGCVVYSTDDFSQAVYGLKMLCAGARLKNSTCVAIKGNRRGVSLYPDLGIKLKWVPGSAFIDEYKKTVKNDKIERLADRYIKAARIYRGPTREDVINGIRAYFASLKILEKENADGITMDCLNILWDKKVSLPCLAWSRLNDSRIPAICEADIGAIASQFIVQYLFDRPGFQQDPVADTREKAVIGAHCTCPTRLNGFDMPSLPFDLIHHHAMRDATARPLWKVGQEITSLDVYPGNPRKKKKTMLLISRGKVLENIDVPPSGGCVVSVKVKFDTKVDPREFPGFHQVFFYGNHRQELKDFAKLMSLDWKMV